MSENIFEEIVNELETVESITREEIRQTERDLMKLKNEGNISKKEFDSLYEELDTWSSYLDKIKEFRNLIKNRNHIEALGQYLKLEAQRDKVSKHIISKLKDLNVANIERLAAVDQKLRNFEAKVESDLEDLLRKKSLSEAESILNKERSTIIFNSEALNDFHKHVYSETYESGKECMGYFDFKLRDTANKPDIVLTEYYPIKDYETQEEKRVVMKEKKKKKFIENQNYVHAHSHPPRGQKSHSQADGELFVMSCEIAEQNICILAIPQSKKLIWTVAQSIDSTKSGFRPRNHLIKTEPNNVPRASMNKYNRAIAKALAYREIDKELHKYSSWGQEEKYIETVYNKINEDNKISNQAVANDKHEYQWIKYLKEEKY